MHRTPIMIQSMYQGSPSIRYYATNQYFTRKVLAGVMSTAPKDAQVVAFGDLVATKVQDEESSESSTGAFASGAYMSTLGQVNGFFTGDISQKGFLYLPGELDLASAQLNMSDEDWKSQRMRQNNVWHWSEQMVKLQAIILGALLACNINTERILTAVPNC